MEFFLLSLLSGLDNLWRKKSSSFSIFFFLHLHILATFLNSGRGGGGEEGDR